MKKLRCDDCFLGTLYQEYVISIDQFEMLRADNLDHKEKIHRLIVYVLPERQPRMFWKFCKILRLLKQTLVAKKLVQSVSVYKSTIQGECQCQTTVLDLLFCNKKVFIIGLSKSGKKSSLEQTVGRLNINRLGADKKAAKNKLGNTDN